MLNTETTTQTTKTVVTQDAIDENVLLESLNVLRLKVADAQSVLRNDPNVDNYREYADAKKEVELAEEAYLDYLKANRTVVQ
jgi:hypothetical protein